MNSRSRIRTELFFGFKRIHQLVVREERSGMLGHTVCEFDGLTGEKLSTSKDVEALEGPWFLGIPGSTEAVEVPCPRFRKCESCPNRIVDKPDKIVTDGEALIRATRVDDAISGVRQF